MDVKALYKHSVRKQWQAMPGQRYQANVVDVEINLAETPKTEGTVGQGLPVICSWCY